MTTQQDGQAAEQPAPPVQHQIKITVTGDRCIVTVVGDTPLPIGRYRGAVIKITDRREAA